MSKFQETEIGNVPTHWTVSTIGQIGDVTKLAGFEYTKHFSYVDDGEIIALRALNVRDGILDLSDIKRIYKKVSDELPRSKLYKNDILFTYVGANIGQFALIPENDKYHLAPNICRIRCSNQCEPYFFYSYLRTNFFKESLDGFSHGSSQPTMPMGSIRQIPVPLPPLLEQKAIASILSSLDDKIDLLHRQNQTLEALAETIFRQWFLKEIESNLNMGKLGDFIEIFDGKRIPLSKMEREKMKEGKLFPYYGAASILDYINDFIFDGDYILMGEDGTVQTDKGHPVLQRVKGQFWANNHAHVLKAKPPYTNDFIYTYLSKTIISNIVTGAVQPKINQANLKSIPFPEFPLERVNRFNSSAKMLNMKTENNKNQIRTLETLRDTLLPKLMSGEVRIDYDKDEVEKVI